MVEIGFKMSYNTVTSKYFLFRLLTTTLLRVYVLGIGLSIKMLDLKLDNCHQTVEIPEMHIAITLSYSSFLCLMQVLWTTKPQWLDTLQDRYSTALNGTSVTRQGNVTYKSVIEICGTHGTKLVYFPIQSYTISRSTQWLENISIWIYHSIHCWSSELPRVSSNIDIPVFFLLQIKNLAYILFSWAVGNFPWQSCKDLVSRLVQTTNLASLLFFE